MVRFCAVAVTLLLVAAAAAQQPASVPPVIKVYMAGKDAVIVLPPGMEYMPEKSKVISKSPTIVVEKTADGGQKLIVRGHTPKVANVGGAKVTIRLGGTFFTPEVHIGIPEGATSEVPQKPDAMKK